MCVFAWVGCVCVWGGGGVVMNVCFGDVFLCVERGICLVIVFRIFVVG